MKIGLPGIDIQKPQFGVSSFDIHGPNLSKKFQKSNINNTYFFLYFIMFKYFSFIIII